MKVWIDTTAKTVGVSAQDLASDLATIDQWIKALRVAREWLRKELQEKQQ